MILGYLIKIENKVIRKTYCQIKNNEIGKNVPLYIIHFEAWLNLMNEKQDNMPDQTLT